MTSTPPLAASPVPASPAPAPRPPAAPDATLRRRSRAAVARSAAGDRSVSVLLGVVLLAAGVLVALLAYGVFGAARAGRPLLDPVIVDTLRAQPLVARVVTIAGGVLLAVLGLVWTARSLRPEPRPDVVLDGGPDTEIVVSAAAVADAVAGQAGSLPGVARARARLVGPTGAPALRVTLWLADDADVRDALRRLDEEVLDAVRTSLGLAALPVAVRVELDGAAAAAPRVA